MRGKAGSLPLYDVVYVGFVTGHGGDALQMLTLASGIQRRGLRIKIIVPCSEDSTVFAERCHALGVECERSSLIEADMLGPKQSMKSLVRLLHANPARIVHVHSGNSCLPRKFMFALEIVRPKRVVATLQSPVETIVPGTVRARTWSFFANRRLDAVVSPSRHGRRFQERCGVARKLNATIRNAIETDKFASGDPSQPRDELGIEADAAVVLFSSRLDPQKRPVEAVEIFARAARELPGSLLVFVGTGSEDAAVAEAATRFGIADRVRLVGYRTNIPDWLSASTVWLLPTERENFSVAVLEALAAGCPVLATDCPGNDEVLVSERNSLTFPVGDIQAASSGLTRLLRSRELREKLRAGALNTAAEHSVQTMVTEVEALYRRLA